MRILNILSGLAVLLTTLAYAHLLHHHFANMPHDAIHRPGFLAAFGAAVVVGIFSFLGGCFLLRRGR